MGAPSSRRSPPSSRWGSRSRSTTSLARPSSTASASRCATAARASNSRRRAQEIGHESLRPPAQRARPFGWRYPLRPLGECALERPAAVPNTRATFVLLAPARRVLLSLSSVEYPHLLSTISADCHILTIFPFYSTCTKK